MNPDQSIKIGEYFVPFDPSEDPALVCDGCQ